MSTEEHYDVVIVGAGIAGGVVAKELAQKGHRVLILEAGTGKDFSYGNYREFLKHYYSNLIKIPNSPYPNNPNANQPLVTDAANITPGTPDTTGYFVQNGPEPFQSTYTRFQGGTTLHWLGTTLRMLPDDFQEKSLYGQGRDWPVSYEEMMPYYRQAEQEIGVSAEVDEQAYGGIHFEPGYVFPMHKIPQSYLDQKMTGWLDGKRFVYNAEDLPIEVVSTPQGRNSDPNPAYNGGEGYLPEGAVGANDQGQRCEGNSACVPICPVQAKYNALKTLQRAVRTGRVDVQARSVATEVLYDDISGAVTGIKYKRYADPNSPQYEEFVAKGSQYVLAAHAVENAKIMLASGLHSTSDQMGRNLMDHPVLLTWASAPEQIGAFRGPGSTSGIPSLRNGDFRSYRSAFRVEIGNWGWNWPTGAPMTQLVDAVKAGLYNVDLRRSLFDQVQRMYRFGFLIEQLPDPTNRVTVDGAYRDALGNYRPVINYGLNDHEKRGMLAARELHRQICAYSGSKDETHYKPSDVGFLEFEGEELWWQGAGHLAGTHVMGFSAHDSVVDRNQRCWDHPNLYMVGCGSMPTVATSNPTLTMTALSFMAAERIHQALSQPIKA